MRRILITVFVANLILTAVSLAVLPDQVAIHFGGGGMPDSWASKEFNAAIFLVLEVPFFLMFYYAHTLARGGPSRFLNIPNKQYWLRSDNQPLLEKKIGFYMAEFGVAIFVFFFCITSLTIEANLNDPVKLNETWFMAVFVGFMLYTLFWLFRLVRALNVPKEKA